MRITKYLFMTVLVLLLVGLLATSVCASENPVYVGAVGSIDMERDDVGSDVSCMTFNVLHYNGSAVQSYASDDYDTRRDYAVSLIRAYDPDIIGMQEAANDASKGYDWPSDLKADLGDTYTPVTLLDLTDQLSQMYICNGLIIWYRTDRFTLLDSGAECYWSYANDCATVSKDRWYQWVKLYDNQENKTVFVFNTHLSNNHSTSTCSVCSTTAEGATAGRTQRTCELNLLANKIHALSQNYPCFVTGDFNSTMSDSLSHQDDTQQHQLLEMSASPHEYLQSSLVTADLQVTSQGLQSIDHVFLNTNYLRARRLVGVAETVNGKMGSDHIPYIAYCDYRAAAQIGPGVYDEIARTYTDTTTEKRYTFSVTPGDGFTYQIYKDTGVKTGDTIWSVKDTSRYEIRFYDADGALYSTVDATIYATSAAKPELTSDGINQYFANHAYHVIADSDTVTVTPVCTLNYQASIYEDEDCTVAVPDGVISGIPAGRSTYYLQHDVYNTDGSLNFSEVFPLYVYRKTAEIHSNMSLYVDVNIGDATGTVAFWDGRDVRLVEGQVTGFASLADAQPTVNTADGHEIYMAAGIYAGNGSSFTKSFSLYGANWNTSPNNRVLEGTWSMAQRMEETVIDGQLLVSLYGNDVITKTVTVQGITFTGETKEGSIYIIENRGGTGTDYYGANSAYKIQLDIRNNIFLGWATQSANGDINVNCASQKCGVISFNYFARRVGRGASKDSDAYPLTYDRAIYGRNINGLLIDSNRFVDFGKEFIYLTSEIGYGSLLPGYGVYTVQDNRFENCISTTNRICNISGGSNADVRYLGNYFIRCGYQTAAIFVDATEIAGTTTNYAGVNLTVMGNKFYECERSIGLFRNGTSLNGDFSQMGLTITQNGFHNPCERAKQPKDGYSAGTAAENYTYNQQSYAHSTIYFRIANSAQGMESIPSAWSLSHNYFYSTRLDDDFVNPYHPTLYLNSYMKEWSGGVVSAEYACFDGSLAAAFVPYYTNHGCTNLSTVDSVDSTASASAVSSVTGISAQGFEGGYDGQGHSITVTVPEGAFVSYSYGDSSTAGYKSYSAENPVFTEMGTYTVTYRVIATGCRATYGSATVTITEPAPEETPELTPAYPTLSVEDEVLLNIYFSASGLGSVGLSDMGLITWTSPRSDGTVDTAEKQIQGATYSSETGYYCVRSEGIPAKNLGDTLYFKIYIRLADGTYLYSNLLSYSPKTYAYNQLSKTDVSDETKALMVAMLNYGACAQTYFEYKPYDLVNSTLTEEQSALVSNFSADMVSAVTAVDSAKQGSFASNGGFASKAPTVSVEGAFAINYRFVPAYTVDDGMVMYYWDQATVDASSVLTADNASGCIDMTADGNGFVAAITGIPAKDIDRAVYVAGVYSSDGSTYSTGVLPYSLGVYCGNQAVAGSEKIQPMAAAIAVYGYYAKVYFSNKG